MRSEGLAWRRSGHSRTARRPLRGKCAARARCCASRSSSRQGDDPTVAASSRRHCSRLGSAGKVTAWGPPPRPAGSGDVPTCNGGNAEVSFGLQSEPACATLPRRAHALGETRLTLRDADGSASTARRSSPSYAAGLPRQRPARRACSRRHMALQEIQSLRSCSAGGSAFGEARRGHVRRRAQHRDHRAVGQPDLVGLRRRRRARLRRRWGPRRARDDRLDPQRRRGLDADTFTRSRCAAT